MGSDDPVKMTPAARRAFEVYRDLGADRTQAAAADKLGLSTRSRTHLRTWSAKYHWVQLCQEHDHAHLKEQLGEREIIKETALQKVIGYSVEMVDVLYAIATDVSVIPVLDRHGKPDLGPATDEHPDGEPRFKPLVKASTRAQAAQTLLGIGGLVAVKRTEYIDRTPESLDEAAALLRTMSPRQVTKLGEILDGD